MKKLVKVRLINWHYLSNETVEIKGNTLLTGPNASGKSTIMDAIRIVGRITILHADDVKSPVTSIRL